MAIADVLGVSQRGKGDLVRSARASARLGIMPLFLTIGYGDQAGYDRTDKMVRDAAHAADAERIRQGDVMGIAGNPVQVRNHDATKVSVVEGAFLNADLPIAGFALIEASDLNAAIEIAACSPCAVAHGVVEVWPLNPTPEGRT